MVAHRSEAQTCKTNIEERGLWGTRLITKKVAKKYFFPKGRKNLEDRLYLEWWGCLESEGGEGRKQLF